MRILLVSHVFHPDPVGTAMHAADLAQALEARGHEVVVFAGRSIHNQTGAALPRRERLGNIDVRRFGRNVFGKGSSLGRAIDIASYALNGLARIPFWGRFDVAICLTTPPFGVLVGLLLKLLRKTRVVYWVMDVHLDMVIAMGMLERGSVRERILRRVHGRILRAVDSVVVLGRCMRDRIADHGIDAGRLEHVPIWPVASKPYDGAANAYRAEWGVGDRIVVMYAGTMGYLHDLTTPLEAARALREDDRIRFAFVGQGTRRAEVDEFVAAHRLDNVIVEDIQPRERVAELLAAGDVHVVTLRDDMWGLGVPSKFFGVAQARRPVVFVGPGRSEVARLVDEWGCGETVAPGDVAALVSVLERLAADRELCRRLGAVALQQVEAHAGREACTRQLAAVAERVGSAA